MLRAAIAALLVCQLAVACGGSAPQATYTRYQFTCCAAGDLAATWHAGQEVTLHWVATEVRSLDSSPHAVVLTVELEGPYSDAGGAKQNRGATAVVEGTSRTDDGNPAPMTPLMLSASLSPGYYSLTARADYGAGNSISAGSVVTIG